MARIWGNPRLVGDTTITGGSLPAAPTNPQIILQGTSAPNDAAMFVCQSATPQCPGYGGPYTVYFGSGQTTDLNEIGWKSVAGATNYAIYRAVNGGAASLLAT